MYSTTDNRETRRKKYYYNDDGANRFMMQSIVALSQKCQSRLVVGMGRVWPWGLQ